jgi:hypothetical protein
LCWGINAETIDVYSTVGQIEHADYHLDGRRLARAIRTDKPEKFALVNAEAQVSDALKFSECFVSLSTLSIYIPIIWSIENTVAEQELMVSSSRGVRPWRTTWRSHLLQFAHGKRLPRFLRSLAMTVQCNGYSVFHICCLSQQALLLSLQIIHENMSCYPIDKTDSFHYGELPSIMQCLSR